MRIYYKINLEDFHEINLKLIKAKSIQKLDFTWSNVLNKLETNDYKIYFDNILYCPINKTY